MSRGDLVAIGEPLLVTKDFIDEIQLNFALGRDQKDADIELIVREVDSDDVQVVDESGTNASESITLRGDSGKKFTICVAEYNNMASRKSCDDTDKRTIKIGEQETSFEVVDAYRSADDDARTIAGFEIFLHELTVTSSSSDRESAEKHELVIVKRNTVLTEKGAIWHKGSIFLRTSDNKYAPLHGLYSIDGADGGNFSEGKTFDSENQQPEDIARSRCFSAPQIDTNAALVVVDFQSAEQAFSKSRGFLSLAKALWPELDKTHRWESYESTNLKSAVIAGVGGNFLEQIFEYECETPQAKAGIELHTLLVSPDHAALVSTASGKTSLRGYYNGVTTTPCGPENPSILGISTSEPDSWSDLLREHVAASMTSGSPIELSTESIQRCRKFSFWSIITNKSGVFLANDDQFGRSLLYSKDFFVVSAQDRDGQHVGYLPNGTIIRAIESSPSTGSISDATSLPFEVVLGYSSCPSRCWTGVNSISHLGSSFEGYFAKLPAMASQDWDQSSWQTAKEGKWVDRRDDLGINNEVPGEFTIPAEPNSD